MTRQALVYSDVSQCGDHIACCNVIVINGGEPSYHEYKPKVTNNVAAEIASLANGIRRCPRDCHVIAYTDINDLPGMVHHNHKVSRASKIRSALDDLLDAVDQFQSARVLHVSRKAHFYRVCHRKAGRVARRLANAAKK